MFHVKVHYILMFLIIGLLWTNAAEAKEIYVSAKGDDKQSGTISNPIQTISAALKISNSGDSIILREGIYEQLTIIRDVKFTQPVTIKPYNDEKVIIDGSKRDIEQSNRAAFDIRDSENIIIKGLEIRNITSNDRHFYPAGILIRGQSKHIKIVNNEIHGIENTHRRGNAHGILVYGDHPNPIVNITIEGNVLHHLKVGKSESLTVSGNVDNFQIIKNRLYDNNNIGIDIAGYYGACVKKGCIDVARNGVVAYNSVLRHSSLHNIAYEGKNSAAGIYVDGGRNIEINNNFVASNNFGISVASENQFRLAENINVKQNLILSNDKAGIIIGGSSSSNGGVKDITLFKNYFVRNDRLLDGYKEITLQQNIENLTLKENHYSTRKSKDVINNNSEPPITYQSIRERIYPAPTIIQSH